MALESIAWILPYLNIFNTVITVILNSAPAVAFMGVIKGVDKYDVIPETMLICNLLNNLGWGCYWHLKNNFMPRLCSAICGTLAAIFGFLYLYYRAEKNCGKFLAFSLGEVVCILAIGYLCLYVIPLTPFGYGLMVINILMYIAPAQNLGRVFKEKNYKLIPIASTLAGAVCSAGWLLFAIISSDINCGVPNGIGVVSSIFTAAVYAYYRSVAKKEDKEEEGQELVEKNDTPEKA